MKRAYREIWKLFDEQTASITIDDVVDGLGCEDVVAEAAVRKLVSAGILLVDAPPGDEERTWTLSVEAEEEDAARVLAKNAGFDLDDPVGSGPVDRSP